MAELSDEDVFGTAPPKELSDADIFGPAATDSSQYFPKILSTSEEIAAGRELGQEHPALENAAQALIETGKELVPRTVEQAAGYLTPAVSAPREIAKAYHGLTDTMFGKPIEQTARANFPEAFQLAEAEKTDPYSKERFKAGFGEVLNLAMGAGIAHGLSDTLFPKPTPKEVIPNAIEEGIKPESYQPEYPGNAPSGTPAGPERGGIVEEGGKEPTPEVTLYHSTPKKFEAFAGTGTPTGLGGNAFYFSDKPEPAYGGNVVEVKIPKDKILDVSTEEANQKLKTDADIRKAGYEGTYNPETREYTVYDPNKFVKPKTQVAAPTEGAAPEEAAGRADVMALAAAEQPKLEAQDLFRGFGEEETPPSQKIGLLPQPSQFVKTDVAKVVQGAIKGAQQVKAAFVPPNVSDVAGLTSRVIRENAAQLARNKEMATVSLQDAASALRKNSPAANLDIINKLETGQTLPSPALNQYKTARQAGYDTRIAQVRAVSPNALQTLIEDYFPHLWTKESVAKVQGNLANLPPDNAWARIFGKRPLAGPATFLKQRTIPTTADGIAIGLEPVTTNPVALDLLKMHEMDRYVMGQKVMSELKDRGVAKFVPAGSKPDFGYSKIDDRIARVLAPREWKIVNEAGEVMPGQKLLGDYYAPDDAARVINNYLSPGLKGNAIYDGFRFVGNLMNQVQLGISMYHASFTAIDSVSSTLALGLEQIVRSGGSAAELAKGGFNIGKALVETPVGSFAENIWRGSKFLHEYSKPGTTNAELARIVDAAVAGGARVRMDTFYKTGAVHSFFDAISKGNYAGATLRAPFALVEAASKPLMEYAVPRMKLGIISQQLEFELGKLPKNASRDDVRTIAARVVDSVDNRMGQLIYDNLFWNRALKDGLMASVRSVGWNLGDIREIGGGVWDTVKAPKRAYDSLTKGSQVADNPVFTKRMAYAVALPLYVGALGSMYQYLMTGEGPKDLQDVYMPRTGRVKADGSPERVMLPTYMKDIYPLGAAAAREGTVGLVKRGYSMALNKLHPALTTIGQMLHNQDYYGNQIRNADDDLVTTIQKEAEFAVKSFRPFSVQGVIQREGGAKEKAQAVVGLMPAPRELTDTPAMRMIHDINLAKRPAGGYTEAQQQKREDKRKASQGQDLRPELFKRLSKEEKEKVLAVATPEERQVFQSAKKPFQLKKKK